MATSKQLSKRIRRRASRRAWDQHSRTMHHLHMRRPARALREVLTMWILYVLAMVMTNKKWSPEDHRDVDGDDAEEAGPMMHISPGVDLLIKMHDLFLAIKRFNLRLSARKLYAYRDSVDSQSQRAGTVRHCDQTINYTMSTC